MWPGFWGVHYPPPADDHYGTVIHGCPKYEIDENGNPVCSECKQAYPYAEPDRTKPFICTSCKSYHDMSGDDGT